MREELLLPRDGSFRPIDDIKVFTFRGVVACSFIRTNVKPSRYRWFDSTWRPIDTGQYPEQVDDSIPPPESSERILEVASEISRRLPIPFIRVDLFDSHKGVYVGELTPVPGDFQKFNAEWDERLGQAYELAESELLRDVAGWRRAFSVRSWLAVRDRARAISDRTDFPRRQPAFSHPFGSGTQ